MEEATRYQSAITPKVWVIRSLAIRKDFDKNEK